MAVMLLNCQRLQRLVDDCRREIDCESETRVAHEVSWTFRMLVSSGVEDARDTSLFP